MHTKRVSMTESDAAIKRGSHATEMLTCPGCGKPQGVFICVLSEITNVNADGHRYLRITTERWICIDCRTAWSENYGVKIPDSGVVSDMFAAYNSSVEGENPPVEKDEEQVGDLLQLVRDKMKEID